LCRVVLYGVRTMLAFDVVHQILKPYCCLLLLIHRSRDHRDLHSFPTRRSSDLGTGAILMTKLLYELERTGGRYGHRCAPARTARSEEHTSELQSRENLVCRLLLEKKKVII